MPILSNAPTPAELGAYGVNRPGTAEVIGQSLYDLQLYPTAGATQFTFFALPIGQGLSSSPGNAGNVKTLADTNMEGAGQLPAPKSQLITSIEVCFQAGSVSTANTFTPQHPYDFVAAPTDTALLSGGAVNDWSAVMENAALTLFIGSKAYLTEAKLSRFVPKGQSSVEGSALATNSASTGALGIARMRSVGAPFAIDPPILLTPNQNFAVYITFPVAIATPSGFNGRIGVFMDGYLYRNSQ